MLYSLSKSFTSTAVGMAVDDGLLAVDDPVLRFFPADAPANPSDNLKAMRVRDLLTMTSGHDKDTLPALTTGAEKNWPKVFLSLPVEHKPGTHFLYNTGATYMLSAIVQKVTGKTLLEYLTPRFFKPLGIDHPTWQTDPEGVNVGGWGLKIKTQDIAVFGQLYLQKGMWNGHRLLSESWIADATSAQVPNGTNLQSDWNQGYGYQFWRCKTHCFRGDGAFGQFCVVMPDQDAVLAITGGYRDMQQVLDLAWKHLLPGMKDSPLSPDVQGESALGKRLATLSHAPVQGEVGSPMGAKVSGKKFELDANDAGISSVTFDIGAKPKAVTFATGGREQRFELGTGRWKNQVVYFEKLGMSVAPSSAPQPVAASGAWAAPDRFVMRAWLIETPYRLDMEFTFDADKGRVAIKRKMHPVQTDWQTIKGAVR
jgi:hypothetical protein